MYPEYYSRVLGRIVGSEHSYTFRVGLGYDAKIFLGMAVTIPVLDERSGHRASGAFGTRMAVFRHSGPVAANISKRAFTVVWGT